MVANWLEIDVSLGRLLEVSSAKEEANILDFSYTYFDGTGCGKLP